jgi:DNA-directed RNA polymerase subunit RPC12/RpoP
MNRACTRCGKDISEGFVIDGGREYYCSERCLYKVYTKEEYEELYDEGNSDTYWTQWEED